MVLRYSSLSGLRQTVFLFHTKSWRAAQASKFWEIGKKAAPPRPALPVTSLLNPQRQPGAMGRGEERRKRGRDILSISCVSDPV